MKKKYLIIGAKPSMVAMIKKVYEQMGDSAEFDADFASVNCHVENMETTKMPKSQLTEFKPFALRGKKVDVAFKILADHEVMNERSEEIKTLIATNKYDAIVNACDPIDEGDLEFQHMIESLGLERKRTERIYLFDLSDSVIESELMTLNEY